MKWILACSLSLYFLIPSFAANLQELKIGVSQEHDSLHPLFSTMVASEFIRSSVIRGMVFLNADRNWEPHLAESIPSLANKTAQFFTVNGQKKIKAFWTIKANAKWGDGAPVICADFELARVIAAHPSVPTIDKQVYAEIEKIESDPKDPKRCTFFYEKAKWDFNRIGRFLPLPSNLEKPVFEKHKSEPEGYAKNSLYVTNPNRPGLYNGPYMISEVNPGAHVMMVPNPHFYGNKPQIPKIILKVISNTGTLEANLRSKTIDMISNIGLTIDQAIQLEKNTAKEDFPFKVVFETALNYEHGTFNLDHQILKDIRVRKAIIMAMDRNALVKNIYEGKHMVVDHFIHPNDPWYSNDPKIIHLKYSRKEANRLLDSAGWKMDGAYRKKGGQKLSITVMTTAGNKSRENMEIFMQDQLKQVGIEMVIKNEIARTYFGDTLKKRKFDAIGIHAMVWMPEMNPRIAYETAAIPSEKNSWSGRNYGGFSNQRFDELAEKLETEFSEKKRKDIAKEMLQIYTKELPDLPLFFHTEASVIPKNLKNYRLTGTLSMATNRIEDWVLE